LLDSKGEGRWSNDGYLRGRSRGLGLGLGVRVGFGAGFGFRARLGLRIGFGFRAGIGFRIGTGFEYSSRSFLRGICKTWIDRLLLGRRGVDDWAGVVDWGL
jgi:hypothetical protein